MTDFRLLQFLLASMLLFGGLGCGIKVQSLREEAARLDHPPDRYPITVQVGRLSGAWHDSRQRTSDPESGLVQALRATQSFSHVLSPDGEASAADLVLRGSIENQWGRQGFKNFLTYFPGGLVFAPNWRGTRWQLRTTADMQLVESQSGKVVGNYTAETEHELVHRSGNPAHFLGAAIVIPGVIQGSMKTWPRGEYKRHMYDTAYPELWRRVATQIVEDRGASFRAELAELRESCGKRYDTAPGVGDSWDGYRACQPSYFRQKGERLIGADIATVFEDTAKRWKIYVVDGQIIQWDDYSARPTTSSGPPDR